MKPFERAKEQPGHYGELIIHARRHDCISLAMHQAVSLQAAKRLCKNLRRNFVERSLQLRGALRSTNK
jgi:hypothetical protein